MSALTYWLWLSELPGLTNQTRWALLQKFETPERIFYADPDELQLTEGITRQQVQLLANHRLDTARKIQEDCHRLNFRILTIHDAEYPGRLKKEVNSTHLPLKFNSCYGFLYFLVRADISKCKFNH